MRRLCGIGRRWRQASSLPSLLLPAALLVACAGAPTSAPTPAPAPRPTPVEKPAPPPEPPPAPVGPVSPAAQQQATKIAQAAIELLEVGNEEQARAELQRALAVDPNNKLAQNLMRQITSDPVAALGRDSFAYVVKPNDSLSKIAQRFLGDVYAFYILARYNDIKVPRQVAGGQTIRVPGKAPPPGAVEPRPAPTPSAPAAPVAKVEPKPAPAAGAGSTPVAAPAAPAAPIAAPEPSPGERAMKSAEAAERAGDLSRALAEYQRAASLDQSGAAAKAEQVRKKLVAGYTGSARSAFAKQDLDGAIRNWDRVLEIDPGNNVAQLEKSKALDLKIRLGNVPK